MIHPGEAFVAALVAKDAARLGNLLAADVRFRGVTPGRTWRAAERQATIDILFTWFDADDEIESVESVECGLAAQRPRVDYQVLVRNPRGLHFVEQRAYFDVTDGLITHLEALCGGFQLLE
jgi:hypothetical protein